MSNATLIDLDNDQGNAVSLKKELQNPESNPQPDPSPAAVPDKYKGKSVSDVIDMHQNAESALGRSNNELGQYKQLTDNLLDLKRQDDLIKGGAAEADIEDTFVLPEVSSTEVLDNPTESIDKIVTARLTEDNRKRDRDTATALAEEANAAFVDRHPDAAEIANDPKFVEWVSASALRLRAAREAYEGDSNAGTELLDEYKASLPASNDDTTEDDAQTDPNLEAARNAATVSTGASQTTDAPKGKTYRRLDLIRLKIEDPEAYGDPAYQQEIMAAYNEGRVI